MIITDISPQKKKKNRVNIFIDGNFSFSLDLKTLVKNNLKVNQEISEDKIEQLIKEGEFVKFYDRAVKFISFRPRSENEVAFFLRKKHAGIKEISILIDKLKEIGLIDDIKFINWWLKQRETFRPRSIKIIMMELLKKGVNRKIIEEIFDKDKRRHEIEMSKHLAVKAKKRYKNLPKKEQRQKMSKFLLQRGFDWEIVKSTIDEIMEKE